VTRSLSRWQALVLGIVVLLGGAGAVAGLFALGGRYWPWDNHFHVRAGFTKVHGIEPGTRVRVQGIEAGEVEDVQFPATAGGKVILVLRLKPAVRELLRSDAAAQIISEGMVGGKVIEVYPGTADDRLADNAQIATLPSADLNEMLAQMGTTLQGLKNGDGTISKLVNDPEAYLAFLKLMQQGERTLASVQQDADALKKVPLIGGYVENPTDALVRVNCERNRWWFPENDLFEAGRAVLTAHGRQMLDDLAPKMTGFKQKGTEVVVVSYADPKMTTTDVAMPLTRQRSEAVVTYLKDKHSIHGPGWISSARKVTAVGMGVRPAPLPESDNPPAARTEVLVFVPQG
jgi:phospholipid/cholesterol/gamma-HCH transport system substrate-binding protein